MDSDEPASPLVQVQFSGEVTKVHLASAYSATNRAATAIVWLFLIVIVVSVQIYFLRSPLIVVSSAWGAIAISVAMILGVIATSFGLYWAVSHGSQAIGVWFIGGFGVGGLVKYRPWLLGPVHGTFSAAFTTIWHREMGIQLISQDLSSYLSWNAYVVRANRRPFAIVPSECFEKSDWHSVLDTLEQRRAGFLLPIPPANDALVCTLLSGRLNFLETRLRGYRWRFSEGGAAWLVAALITMVSWPWTESSLPDWAFFAAIPGLVLVFYFLRIAVWTWHTRRQFANELRGYLAVEETHPERVMNWFNSEVVFWSNGRMWIHMPIKFIDQIAVNFSSIEFKSRGIHMLFHREGFRDESHWLMACDKAGKLLSSLDSKPAS